MDAAPDEDVWGKEFGDRKLVRLDDIVDKAIVIEDFEEREGAFGKYYSVYLEGNLVVNSGSVGVMAKLDAVREQLPLEGMFKRKELESGRRLYTIVGA